MKITKYEHACLDIQQGSNRLVIDPGVWSDHFDNFEGVTALVITHVHADHLDEAKIQKLFEGNPELRIYGTQQVAAKLSNLHIQVPDLDQQYQVGDFRLEFFGGKHAIIMDTMPQDQNFGVLVNDLLYFPGDSLTPCPKPHKITAAPSVAPWLKLSEAADFISQDTAEQVFPTHNAIVNEIGNNLINSMLSGVAQQSGKKYLVLQPGESMEIA